MMNIPSDRGRPVDPDLQDERRNRLMDAALELLQAKSYRSLTIREIAEKAGMKSAMIAYYFGNKEGLVMALVKRHADADLARFQTVADHPQPLLAFISMALQGFAANPAIVRFISDEVMSQAGPLRDRFIQLMPARMARLVPALIEGEQKAGRVRKDLNPKWAAFSLMTMIVMPFVGAPVRDAAWQISHDEVTSEAWAQHIFQLFMMGCAERGTSI